MEKDSVQIVAHIVARQGEDRPPYSVITLCTEHGHQAVKIPLAQRTREAVLA